MKPFKTILALVVIATMIISCSPKPQRPVEATEAPMSTVEATTEKVTVTMWDQSEGDLGRILQEEFVKSFNDAHPNVELVLTFQEDNERQVQTALQAGAAPDLITTSGPFTVFALQQGDHVLAMDKYAEQYGWKDTILPWAYETGSIKGSLYSLPLTMESLIVFYNKNLLEGELGLKTPTNLQELEAICEAAKEIGKWCFSGAAPFDGFWTWEVWENYIGSDHFYRAMTDQEKWTDPAFKSAIQLTQDWIENGWVSGDLKTYMGMTYDDLIPPLAKGDAVFMGNGAWAFDSVNSAFLETDQDWDWFAWPSLNPEVKGVYDLSVGSTISINAASKHPDEAAMVIDWLYNNKARAAKIIEGMNFSQWVVPLKFETSDFSQSTDPRLIRYLQDFSTATGEGKIGYTHWTYLPDTIGTPWIENQLDSVWTGEMSIDDFLMGLQNLFDKEYASGNVITPPAPNVR